MSFTTANSNRRGAGTIRVLALSTALQVVALALFIAVEPLRITRLTISERDVREHDAAAAERLRERRQQERRERADTRLPTEQVERILEQARQREAPEINRQLDAMQQIRDDLLETARERQAALAERTLEDVSAAFYAQLHPLVTQLVAHAESQQNALALPATPTVTRIAHSLRQRVEQHRAHLLHPDLFTRLQAAHRLVQQQQANVINQLDAAQQAYRSDTERIARENHTEYLVNRARDDIGDLLGLTAALDPTTMNQLPDTLTLPASTEPPSNPADSNDLAALHAQADQLYQDIRQAYTVARAADLALRQNQSGIHAAAQTHLPAAIANDAPPNDQPGTPGALEAHTAARAASRRGIAQRWQAAMAMHAASQTASAGPVESATAHSDARAAQQNAAQRIAAQQAAAERAGRFADMTTFQLATGGEGERGFSGAFAGGRDVTAQSIRSGYRETGAGTPGANPALLSETRVLAQALPGRIVDPASPRTGWLYIDTWYIIGPWENHGRLTFQPVHPPETLIDLDATYTGKQNRTLTWQFHQSDNIRIKPPLEMEQATYYAYTEVYCVTATDLLIAVASDDAARVWLNDTLIWQDQGNSPWRLDEGFRRVHFRAGFNTLLVRIENGPVTCTFSLLLCPPNILQTLPTPPTRAVPFT